MTMSIDVQKTYVPPFVRMRFHIGKRAGMIAIRAYNDRIFVINIHQVPHGVYEFLSSGCI